MEGEDPPSFTNMDTNTQLGSKTLSLAGWVLRPSETEDQSHLKPGSCYYPQTTQCNNHLYCIIDYIPYRDSYQYTGCAWAICHNHIILHKGQGHPSVLPSAILTPIPEHTEAPLCKQPEISELDGPR